MTSLETQFDEGPPQFWQVAVAAPLKDPLTYLSPLPSASKGDANCAQMSRLQRGMRVWVPLGKRYADGVVLGPCAEDQIPSAEGIVLKSVQAIQDQFPILPIFFLSWLEWVAHYYIYPLGMTLDMTYPPLKKQKSNSRRSKKSEKPSVVPLSDRATGLTSPILPTLTPEQDHCIQNIPIDPTTTFQTHLIFGVTGSGKTEIYLRLLQKVLALGKTALVLVPEISLTPQLIRRFVDRFGNQVAAIHSHLTEREKTDQWWSIVNGEKTILIGARSALFCPMKNLGIIIVDEEHEPSYKQDEKLKYHGRDAAIVLAKFASCPVVLGSATPSLESWKNAQDGKYILHTLKNRV